MSEAVEKVFDGCEPYKCPDCGTELDCFFHERDSTSNNMRCPKCGWWAFTDWNAEWHSASDKKEE